MLQEVINQRLKLHESCNANKHDIDCDQKSEQKIPPSEPVSNMQMNFAFEAKTSDFRFKLHKSYNANEHVSDCDKKSNKITPSEPVSNMRMNFAFATKTLDFRFN